MTSEYGGCAYERGRRLDLFGIVYCSTTADLWRPSRVCVCVCVTALHRDGRPALVFVMGGQEFARISRGAAI